MRTTALCLTVLLFGLGGLPSCGKDRGVPSGPETTTAPVGTPPPMRPRPRPRRAAAAPSRKEQALRRLIRAQKWNIVSWSRMPADQVAGVGARLGGPLSWVTNVMVGIGSLRYRINLFRAKDAAAAGRIAARLRRIHAKKLYRVGWSGPFLVEQPDGTPVRAHLVRTALGLLDRTVRRYRLDLELGLLERGDQAAVNRAFVLLLGGKIQPGVRHDPSPAALRAAIQGMLFGNTLRLRAVPVAGTRPRYQVLEGKATQRNLGDAVVITATAPPKRLGLVPYLKVRAEIPTQGWTDTPAPAAPPKALTAATTAWPTGAPAVKQTLAAIGASGPPAKRLAAIHQWVYRHIRYGGPAGSRLGTLAVLEGKQGQCWDKSDLVITLLRAAGIPARQVGGWVVGTGGHIWAEAWLAGRGWVPVDATAPWLGVPGRYVPFLISSDGRMQVFHLVWPRIQRLR